MRYPNKTFKYIRVYFMAISTMLCGLKVALLVASGFEYTEMEAPKKALEEAGAIVQIVSPEEGIVQGYDCYASPVQATGAFTVNVPLKTANAENFDALVIPGGMFIDDIRKKENAMTFIEGFKDKPIASICHGQQLLIGTSFLKGKTLTSYWGIEIDLVNAGGIWVDREVVRDGLLVTSRWPADVPAFIQAMLELFKEYLEKRQTSTL